MSTQRPGKTLTIFPDGSFEVSEYVPYEGRTYIGPACYFPVSEKSLQQQIEFYRSMGGPDAVVDLRGTGSSMNGVEFGAIRERLGAF